MLDILREAASKVGSIGKLAKAIGISRQALHQFRRTPAERVLDIERATGGKITRHQLRPDLYPLDDEGQAA